MRVRSQVDGSSKNNWIQAVMPATAGSSTLGVIGCAASPKSRGSWIARLRGRCEHDAGCV